MAGLPRTRAIYGDAVCRGASAALRLSRRLYPCQERGSRLSPHRAQPPWARHRQRRAAQDSPLLPRDRAVEGHRHARPPPPAALCRPPAARQEDPGRHHPPLQRRLHPSLVGSRRGAFQLSPLTSRVRSSPRAFQRGPTAALPPSAPLPKGPSLFGLATTTASSSGPACSTPSSAT